jgi:SAM-dependent methyltransferase
MEDKNCLNDQNEYDQWSLNEPVTKIMGLNAPSVNLKEKEFIKLANPTKILDIGCGNGKRLFSYLSDMKIPFLGIEKFGRLIEQSNFKDFILVEDLLQLNASNLERRFENIDVITIVGGSLLGIFCYKNQQSAWNKIMSLLPTGGRIIFDTFMITGFETVDFIGTTRLFPAAPPQYLLSEKQLKALWNELNLEIIKTSDLDRPPIRYYLLQKNNFTSP